MAGDMFLKEVADMIKSLEPEVLRILDIELRLARIKGAERVYDYAVGYIDGVVKTLSMISREEVYFDKFKDFMVELIAMATIKVRWERNRDLETPVGYYPVAKELYDIFRESGKVELLKDAVEYGW